jgi:hypothetical protein
MDEIERDAICAGFDRDDPAVKEAVELAVAGADVPWPLNQFG